MKMEYQRFIPEGWDRELLSISKDALHTAKNEGTIMQGLVTKCDSNFNLHVDLGNNIFGIVPRDEIENLNLDENGFPKPRNMY